MNESTFPVHATALVESDLVLDAVMIRGGANNNYEFRVFGLKAFLAPVGPPMLWPSDELIKFDV
jgi:hypothetical protein